MHFFTDHTLLTAQQVTDGFGPDSESPSTKYNLTSKFQLISPAKAFACQSGMLVVQQSSATDGSGNPLLNIALKPTDTLFSSGVKVAYYIYRGISMDSLITTDGTNIIAYDADTNNDLVARIYSAGNIATGGVKSDVRDDDTNIYVSGYLGYDNDTLDASLQVDEIFYSSTSIQPIKVNEGDWFGNFSAGDIGFEVVMEPDKLNITLELVRGQNTVIDISSLTDPFEIKATREQILGFIDPAALFGLHFTAGINVNTGDGSPKAISTLSGQNLYDTILSLFYTCNTVYVDIRNERGYSYNFYSNYGLQPDGSIGSNIQIGPSADDTDLVAQIYSNNSWPILIIADGQSTSFSDTENAVYLALRIDDNVRPILYNLHIGGQAAFNDIYPDGDYDDQDGDDGNDVDDDGPVDAYSNPFSYTFPVVTSSNGSEKTGLFVDNANDDPPKKRVVYYIKSHYYMRQSSVSGKRPKTALGAQKYYHSTFCPIDLPNIGNTNSSYVLRKVENPHALLVDEPLNINTGFGGFTFASGSKVVWDNNCILFYSSLLLRYTGSGKKFIPITLAQKIAALNTSMDDLFRQLDIICKTYQKSTTGGTPQNINIIGVNNYSVIEDAEKESALFFGVSKAEFDAIVASNQLISNLSHRYIYLQRSDTYVYPDASTPSGGNFYEYIVMVQGLNSAGFEAFVTPMILDPVLGEQPIFVYSKDNLFFNSIAFGLLENVTPGTNQIQYNATSDGEVHVNSNIDPIPPQPISFYYNGTYITQFKTANSDKYYSGQPLGRANKPKDPPKVVIPSTGVPTGYDKLLFDYRTLYPDIDAKQSFIKTNGDILTWGTHPKTNLNYQVYYRRAGRKNIMVHFDNTGFDNYGIPSTNTYPLHIQALNVDVKLTYPSTQRRFAQPRVAAIVIAILIETKLNLASGGFSLDNGTCFPSVEHVNGEAVDLEYYPNTANMNVNINEAIIDRFTKYQFTDIIIGLPKDNPIFDQFESTSNGIKIKQRGDHDTHLHCGKLKPVKK